MTTNATPGSSSATATTGSATATTSASVGMLSHCANILPLKHLDILACQSNVENWCLWKQQWLNCAIVTGLDTCDLVFQCAMFQSVFGTDALQVFNTMVFTDDQYTEENILDKFEVMMNGELNETLERHVFNSRNQHDGESTNTYVTELRRLAKSCKFCNCLGESLLCDRLLVRLHNVMLRKRLLQMKNPSLEQCLAVCRASELAEVELIGMLTSTSSVNKVVDSHSSGSNFKHHPRSKSSTGSKGSNRFDFHLIRLHLIRSQSHKDLISKNANSAVSHIVL